MQCIELLYRKISIKSIASIKNDDQSMCVCMADNETRSINVQLIRCSLFRLRIDEFRTKFVLGLLRN